MLKKRDETKFGSFLCKLLRHNPPEFQLDVDEYGFANAEDLLRIFANDSYWREKINHDVLCWVVEQDGCRYEWNENQNKIRTLYGHSIPVLLPHVHRELPSILYHGSHQGAMECIKEQGILPMSRLFVHLAEETSNAERVARRRKSPVVLEIDVEMAKEMKVKFQYAGNHVWLSSPIPFRCIQNVITL